MPKIVQRWERLDSVRAFRVHLFNGMIVYLDMDNVRAGLNINSTRYQYNAEDMVGDEQDKFDDLAILQCIMQNKIGANYGIL